jgi:membrane protein DedA with SNARE-associated domain
MSFSPTESLIGVVTLVLSTIGLPGLFALMTVESIGIPPLPSEVILPFAGFLVAEGIYPLVPTLLVALVGGLVGAYIAYAVGRWGRERLLHVGIGRLRLEPHHLERMDRFFARRGEVTVAVARCAPVVRSYVSYPAGTAKMNPVKFGVYTLVGSTPFVLGLVYAGIELGAHWSVVTNDLQYFDLAFWVLVIAGVAYLALVMAGVLRPSWLEHPRPVEPSPTEGPAPPPR